MSDIYLQITETPTVVTLSAPVISGALSSTVTVANTVTVALDANSLSALENVTVTVGAAITGTVTVSNFPAFPTTQAVTFSDASLTNTQLRASAVTVGGTVTVGNTVTIAGTVSLGIQQSDDADANIKFIPIGYATVDGGGQLDQWTAVDQLSPLPVYFPSNNPLPAGTNRIGVVTIGAGTVTIGAGTAQIGSVTASISGTVPISISSVTVGNSVTIGSLPAISGTVTANTFAVQGTAVTTSNFTSTTASTVLANYNATREVLTIFNEGAGNLFVSAGATCTTVQYQVRLGAGDYYEVPNHQTTITHSAVFATAGTARVTEVS